MAALDVIASELLKSAREADLNYKKTRDLAERDKAIRLRKIVENLKLIPLGASDLNGLDDVTISAPANAQVLTYNSTSGQWENQTPAAGGGGDMLKSTYDVDNDGIVDGAETIQIIVRNSTGSTLTKGTVVYLSGATGNRPNAVRAQANTEATSSKTIGIVIANIANNSDGYIAVNGTLHNLDTSAFTAGDAVWLSATTAGAFTATVPAEPNHAVFVGYIARAHPTQGRIVLHFQNGYEFDELHGVLLSSPANNDLVVYESSTSLWKNKSISTIFGGTPLVSVPTLAQVTTAGNTTSNTIIYSGTTEAIRPSVDSTGALGASNFRWLNVYTRGVNSGANSLDILGTNINLNDNSGNIKLRVFGSTGNVVIQNGGTFTDAGYRLDVNGTLRNTSDAYFATTSGSVSIGTVNTPEKLNIYGGNIKLLSIQNTADAYRYIGTEYNNANGNNRAEIRFVIDGSDTNTRLSFHTAAGAGTINERMRIGSTGNVGIGTTSLNQKLTVSGIIEAGSASATAGAVTLYQSYSSPNYLGSMSTEWGSGAMILGYGTVGKSGIAGFVSTFANFTGLRAAIRLGQGTVSIFSSLTAVNTAVGSDLTMTETVRISESGNVGIGTNNPQTKIHLGTTNSSVRIDTSLSNSAFLTGWQDAVAIGVNRDPQNGNFTNTSKAAASIFLYGQSNSSFINFSTTTSNNTLPTERMRLESSGNLLINTTTDSGYKLNVNGTAYIGGVATLNSDANVAGSIATPQITARRYYQNPNGVPSNNLGDPTVTEMALFDKQFDNKTAFYPSTYGTSIFTFETYNGTTWTDISASLTDTQKRQLFGGDTPSSVAIPYGTVQYQITITNPGPYVSLNAFYAYWSGSGHSTQVHIWGKHNSGSWTQITNSTTTVSSWPGHLYLPHTGIWWHPNGSLGTHVHQVRVVFTPTWNATYPTNNIALYNIEWWGGYPAGRRLLYSADENKNVTFPSGVTAAGTLFSAGAFTANSSSTFAQLATFNNSAVFNNAAGTSAIRFQHNGTNRGILGVDGSIYGVSTANVGLYVYGANDLEFSTDNVKRLIAKANGNILIGTTTDSGYKLDVAGTARVTNGIYFSNSSGSFLWELGAYALRFGTNNTERMRIDSSGNLGIGRTSPAALLHIGSDSTTSDALIKLDVQYDTGRTSRGGILWKDGTNTTGKIYTEYDGSQVSMVFGSLYSGGYNSNQLMIIRGNGNVGIGTTSPSYKLQVNGSVYFNGSTNDFYVDGFSRFGGTNSYATVITNSGSIGVGTTSPVYKVDVQGTTLTTSSVRVQGAFDVNPLAAPPAIGGFTLSAGTNLGVGQYYYFVVYVTALGETSAGATLLVTTTTGNTTVNLTGIPVSTDPRVTARKIYRTLLNQTSDAQRFLATISDNVTTTYTDSATDASLTGVALQYYKVNTTARYFTVSGVQGMVVDQNLTALGRNAGNAIIASSGAAIRTVLIGAQAGQNITTGQANVIVGVAGGALTTGSSNSLLGDLAGQALVGGSSNTMVGGQVGRFLTSGGNNTILGSAAGRYLYDGSTQFTTGANNVIVGADIRVLTASDSNSIIIGWDGRGLGSNTTVIGNSSTTFTSIPAGNLGVGTTTNAGYKLDVNGTARVQGNLTVTNGTISVSGGDITTNYSMQLGNHSSGRYIGFGGWTNYIGGDNTSNYLVFNTNSSEKMRITSSGNVGIGIAAPTDKLHIVDSNNANIFGRITATGTNASAAWVAMNNQNDNVVYRVFGDGVSGSQMGISLVRSASLLANLGGSGKFLMGTYSATDVVFGTNDQEKMRLVDNTGNFLIGTTTDNGNKLQVNGTIDGQAFAVNGVNGWTGTIVIMTNPPGQQNIQVQNGIITNVF